jgi:SAM-dependent methyltransferase
LSPVNASDELNAVMAEGRLVRLIEDDIYSVLPDTNVRHHYDHRATLYDSIVSTRLYNFVAWGTSPSDYVDFAGEALTSSTDGRFLDAGCGSLLFTAHLYANSNRSIIACDQSIAMLRRARQRLVKLSGRVPEHIRLLQGDLSDLPFRPRSFSTILCLNVLHQFADAAALISALNELTSTGSLYLTSLVSTSRTIGDGYLKALHATGEFVRPRSRQELREILTRALGSEPVYRLKGNMAFVTIGTLPRKTEDVL